MVPQAASANWVRASPMRRSAHISNVGHRGEPQPELVARMVAAEVRSANKSPCVSLIRFSMSPLAQ